MRHFPKIILKNNPYIYLPSFKGYKNLCRRPNESGDKHRQNVRKQEMVDAAVEEVIRKLVTNPKFEQAIRPKIGSRIDTEELLTR